MVKTPATYSVKYLGIVDGNMGILSRKMAMQTSHIKERTSKVDDIVKVNLQLAAER